MNKIIKAKKKHSKIRGNLMNENKKTILMFLETQPIMNMVVTVIFRRCN